MNHSISLFIILLLTAHGYALASGETIESADTVDTSTGFHFNQLIAPGALIALGAVGAIDYENNVNTTVNDWFDGSRHTHCDDWLRFMPSATFLGIGFIPGVKVRHQWSERLLIFATSHVLCAGLSFGLKYTVNEPRPNLADDHSFPSGHVSLAFTGAELLRKEYGTYWGLAGYGIATGVAVLRLHNQKHWLNDVLMGAGIGILSAKAAYWLLPFERRLLGLDGNRFPRVAIAPGYNLEAQAPSLTFVAQF